jgi:hypothetical protein
VMKKSAAKPTHVDVLRAIFRGDPGPSLIEKRDAFRVAINALEDPRETFDPQAVRELLEAIDTMQAGGAPIAGLLAASRRVRGSEKK